MLEGRGEISLPPRPKDVGTEPYWDTMTIYEKIRKGHIKGEYVVFVVLCCDFHKITKIDKNPSIFWYTQNTRINRGNFAPLRVCCIFSAIGRNEKNLFSTISIFGYFHQQFTTFINILEAYQQSCDFLYFHDFPFFVNIEGQY